MLTRLLRNSRTNGWLDFLKQAPPIASPTFLTIPGELRNRIYALCLLENELVYPYDYKPCGCDCPKNERVAPSVGLLAANRQISTEATPLLYGGVTFHIETGYAFMRFSSPSKHICMYSHPTEDKLYPSRHLIRSLNFEILPEILERGRQASRMRDFWRDGNFRSLSTRQRALAIHEYVKTLSETVWEQAGEVVVHMRGLRKLQLDIEKALCPQGCCRMVGHVVKALKGLKTKEGLELAVVGDMVGGEVEKVVEGLKYDASLSSRLENGYEDEDEDEDDDDSDEDEDGSDVDLDEVLGRIQDSSEGDDIPALSEVSDIDTDLDDSSSDISSASTIPPPTDMLDPGSLSRSADDDLAH